MSTWLRREGQIWINPNDDFDAKFAARVDDAILEAAIDFECEASFLLARASDGRIAHFPVSLNTHQKGFSANCGPAQIDESF